jgi:hypothetical protein
MSGDVRLNKEGTDRFEGVHVQTGKPVKDDSKEGHRSGDHERNLRNWMAVEGVDAQHCGVETGWGRFV